MDIRLKNMLTFQRNVLLKMRWLLDDDMSREVIRALIDILHNIPTTEEELQNYNFEWLHQECEALHEIWEDEIPAYLNLMDMLQKIIYKNFYALMFPAK